MSLLKRFERGMEWSKAEHDLRECRTAGYRSLSGDPRWYHRKQSGAVPPLSTSLGGIVPRPDLFGLSN